MFEVLNSKSFGIHLLISLDCFLVEFLDIEVGKIGAFHENRRLENCELDKIRSLSVGDPPRFGVE